MVTFSLVVFPGNGAVMKTVPYGTTLAKFINDNGLQNRGICINGEAIDAGMFGQIQITNGIEIAALAPTKGNS